jgi:superfamily I DNA/RNA helicase
MIQIEGKVFNEEQQAAIDADSGTWQVLAGPGSGKTAVLVERYHRLARFAPLCLTFTVAAANEMKSRAGGGNFRTIHSAAYQVLKSYSGSAGFIAPPLDQLVKHAINVLKPGRPRFKYVMIDEAQDCSADDWEFISRLSQNIFAVGDAMQCVFGFRGSKPELFLDMAQRFPGTDTLYLGRNYRSTQQIVDFCKKIAPVRGALLEKLCSENEPGEPVQILGFAHNVEEAEFVISQVQNPEHGYTGSSVALARTNRQLDVFKKLGAPSYRDAPGYLELSTIHAAKGKEWDNVFVIGTQQGLLPFRDGDIDEESRIMFVAASRARKRLFLTRYGTPSILIN